MARIGVDDQPVVRQKLGEVIRIAGRNHPIVIAIGHDLRRCRSARAAVHCNGIVACGERRNKRRGQGKEAKNGSQHVRHGVTFE